MYPVCTSVPDNEAVSDYNLQIVLLVYAEYDCTGYFVGAEVGCVTRSTIPVAFPSQALPNLG